MTLQRQVASTAFWQPHLAIVLLLLNFSIGCGNSGTVTKRVVGNLTFAGDPPPKEGKITFAPLTATPGYPRRPANGNFDADGRFTLTTFEAGDGIIPGTYSVNISCWREKPTLETKLTANYVQPGFTAEISIDADAPEPVTLDVDVPSEQIQL